jgi:uncharacterized membrane protein (UPF0127 family)
MKPVSVATIFVGACTPTEPNALDKLGTVDLQAKNLSVRAWIADESDEHAKGLMFVTAEEMAPLDDGAERGMLFVFPRDQRTGFWMRNTIIDLDIAYITESGDIVQTFTMTALDENSYTPRSAYRYALEVRAGVFEREGITEDDRIDIPETVLKRAP